MALRDFTDSSGNRWRVWNVAPHVPTWGSDPSAERPSTPEDDGGGEAMLLQRRLVPGLEGGWLCFEAEEEKRRLNPIPEAWEELADPDLQRLLEQAAPVNRRNN
jgi:hypothetical protein